MNATRYSKADVLGAAMRLLDEVGLPDLTMRKLAASLDLQPSAIYWHFESKQSLLAEMSNSIVAFAKPVVKHSDWRANATAEALALRDALLAFRDGAEIVSSTLALGLGANGFYERIFAAVTIEDLSLRKAAAESIQFLVLGQVWHEQQRMQANSLGVVDNLDTLDSSGLGIGIQLILNGVNERVTK
jgi:AcrR family transcriptional regulator